MSHVDTGSDTDFDLMVKIQFIRLASRPALLAQRHECHHLCRIAGSNPGVEEESYKVQLYLTSKKNTLRLKSLLQM